jgi:hypothetical protein
MERIFEADNCAPRQIYAAVVAASASCVAGGFAKPPDAASMQPLRASLSEDT